MKNLKERIMRRLMNEENRLNQLAQGISMRGKSITEVGIN